MHTEFDCINNQKKTHDGEVVSDGRKKSQIKGTQKVDSIVIREKSQIT